MTTTAIVITLVFVLGGCLRVLSGSLASQHVESAAHDGRRRRP
jgi:hypothetical protein